MVNINPSTLIGALVNYIPPIGDSYTARFGIGSEQGSGTGAFDTSLYPGATPADGTYGDFTVASGIITPDGTQVAGTYNVGGWPVEVISGYVAVATQAHWDTLAVGLISGKTVLVREGAAITCPYNWNTSADFGWATILGDGEDPRLDMSSGKDSRKHFVSIIQDDIKKLTYDNLRIVTGSAVGAWVKAMELTGTGGVGVNWVEDIKILRSVFLCSRPNPYGDYSGGAVTYPGTVGIQFGGNSRRLSIRDNVIYGACGNPAALAVNGASKYCEIIGNWIDLFYVDGIRPPSAEGTLLGGNYLTRPMSVPGDSGDPHCDGTQFLAAQGTVEASAYIDGPSRGVWQSLFSQDGNTSLTIRNILVSENTLYQISVGDPDGTSIQNCTWLPKSGASFPLSNPRGGIRFDIDTNPALLGTNDLLNSVFRHASSVVHVGVTLTGNVDSQSWVEADWDTNYPNWDMPTVPTLQNALQVNAAGVAAAAGKGANQNITSWGAERSSYVLNVTTPTVSNISLTPTSGGFTGTLRTDVGNNQVYWAVIPQAQGNPTYREIKERRVPNGIGYGDVWCSRANAGTNLSISVTGCSPSTAYKLCVVAENGWSKQSAVTTANFTTTA